MNQDNSLEFATQSLLVPANLNEQQLEDVLGKVMTRSVDSADIFLQASRGESWTLEDSIVKTGDFTIDRGFGLRVMSGEKTGFAYADEIALSALQNAAYSAQSIARGSHSGLTRLPRQIAAPRLYPEINPIDTLAEKDKIALLHQIDSRARSLDPRVQQVMVTLSASYNIILLVNSEGVLAADIRPLVSLWVKVIAEEKGAPRTGQCRGRREIGL